MYVLDFLVGSEIISSEAKEIVQVIGERVQGIVGNLKNQSVLIEGDQSPSVESVDLIESIDMALREAQTQYSAIEWNKPNKEVRVKAARSDLTRVISNILNNAIEASLNSKNPIAVSVSDGANVTLTIKDGGDGIAPELLHKLGEKGVTHGKHHGKGLGLYHAKSCLLQWGGTLTLDSHQGAGTTVTLVFMK